MQQPETAIIPSAGTGTRAMPATWAVEKSLLSIHEGDKSTSVASIMVDECALAGIKRIIMVTTERGYGQLHNLFGPIDHDLETRLINIGKKDIVEAEQERRKALPKVEWVFQPADKYGTAYPPYLAHNLLEGEKNFVLMGGDDFVWRQDGTSDLFDAMTLLEQTETDHVIMGNPLKKRTDGPNYGILRPDEDGKLERIDEKPPLELIGENEVANISRYILKDTIWDCIDEVIARDLKEGQEYFITDVINRAIDLGQTFQVYPVSGLYFDCGTPRGLREASNYFTDHPRKIAA